MANQNIRDNKKCFPEGLDNNNGNDSRCSIGAHQQVNYEQTDELIEEDSPSFYLQNDVVMTRFTDGSYLRTIPEGKFDDDASSVGGDLCGTLTRKAMSTTSSTAAMVMDDDGDVKKRSTNTRENSEECDKSQRYPGFFRTLSSKSAINIPIEGSHGRRHTEVRSFIRLGYSGRGNTSASVTVPSQTTKSFGPAYKEDQKLKQREFWSKILTRPILLGILGGILLFTGVLTAIVIVVRTNNKPNSEESGSNNQSPNSNVSNKDNVADDKRLMATTLLDEYLRHFTNTQVDPSASGNYEYTVFNDTNSAQYKARHWMSNDDGMLVEVVEEGPDRFLQRFGLVVIYFELNGPYWASSSSSNGEGLSNPPIRINFLLPHTHECQWPGVACYVVDGENDNNDDSSNTTPRIPEEKTDPGSLRKLFNRRNTIRKNWMVERRSRWIQESSEGSISSNGLVTVGRNPQKDRVSRFQMSASNVSGSLPYEIAAIKSLVELDLSFNDITGTIPVEIFDVLDGIQVLDLSSNQIIGSIPSILWSLPNLSLLYLNDNNFTGHIESRFIRSTSLQHVWIQRNQLDGPLPYWFSELNKLTTWIAFENKFNGTIPRPVPRSLQYFDLSNNQVTGSIPESLWSEPEYSKYARRYYLDNNLLSGTLPEADQAMNMLRSVWLHNNRLTGTIPKGFAEQWPGLEQLRLSRNNLTGVLGKNESDCNELWPNLIRMEADCDQYCAEEPPVLCPCCTFCPTRKATCRN